MCTWFGAMVTCINLIMRGGGGGVLGVTLLWFTIN